MYLRQPILTQVNQWLSSGQARVESMSLVNSKCSTDFEVVKTWSSSSTSTTQRTRKVKSCRTLFSNSASRTSRKSFRMQRS